MADRSKLWQASLAILLLIPGAGFADSLFSGWLIQPRDCPRSQYCPAHYWVPEWYRVRAVVCPSNLDQFPPGHCPPVAPMFESTRYRCRSTGPAPSSAYADPGTFYGRTPAAPELYGKERSMPEAAK